MPNASKESFFPFFTEKGLEYSELYDKQTDSSCVLKYRFSRGSEFIEFRMIVGDTKINLVVYANGEFRFPSLEARHKKLVNSFKLKHLFKKPTEDENWTLVADMAKEELKLRSDFFGIFR